MKLTRSVSVIVREAVRNTLPTVISSHVCPRARSGGSIGPACVIAVAPAWPVLAVGPAWVCADCWSEVRPVLFLDGPERGHPLLPQRGNALRRLRKAEPEKLIPDRRVEHRAG